MDNLNDQKEFSVALLIDDMKKAHQVSKALRDIGIFAHIYQSLDNFWVSVNNQTPDLAIVDVKCMGQGNMLLRNHPKVKNNELHFCFLYKNTTIPLLGSTKGIHHFGLINLDVDLETQIHSALLTRNRQLEIENKNKNLKRKVDSLQTRSVKMMNEARESYNFENQFSKLESVLERFGTLKASDNFNKRLSSILEAWQDCKNYSFYELNQTGQKLISSKIDRTKYKELPDLWLTRQCDDGMEGFAIEMAEEVAFDIYEASVRVIKISATKTYPQMLIIAQFDEDKLNDFQWNWLEHFLNAKYCQLDLKKMDTSNEVSHQISTHECLNYLDDLHYHFADNKHKVFTVSFAPMIEQIRQNNSNRFFWKAFFNDYQQQLNNFLSGNFKIANYGAHNLVVMIDLKNLEKDFNGLRHFVGEFPYWRYFEDSTALMNTNIIPIVKTIAPSAISLLRVVDGKKQVVVPSKTNNELNSFI